MKNYTLNPEKISYMDNQLYEYDSRTGELRIDINRRNLEALLAKIGNLPQNNLELSIPQTTLVAKYETVNLITSLREGAEGIYSKELAKLILQFYGGTQLGGVEIVGNQ